MGGLEVGAYNALGYWAQANALKTSPSSTVAFICSLQVVVVPILNAVFKSQEGNKSLREAILPALLAVVGVACLELGGLQLPGVGDLWALLQPLTFGLAFWRVEAILQRCKKPHDAQGFTAASLLVVATAAAVWAAQAFALPLWNGPHGADALTTAVATQLNIATHNWQVGAALLWTGVVTTALTTYGENVAMQHVDAAESTVIYSTEPLWGTLFAAVALHEKVGLNTVVGAVFILAACSWRTAAAGIVASLSALQESTSTAIQEVSVNVGANLARLLDIFKDMEN